MQIEAAVRAIEELSALLLRELGSVASYDEALESLGTAGTSLAATLLEMKREHVRNARTLRAEITRLGGTPVGAVGVFSAFGDDSADRVGLDEAAVLRSLASCEERALRNYEDAAERLPAPCGALLWEVLVPARRRHVAALRHLARLATSGHADCNPSRVAAGSRISLDAKEVAI